MAKVTKRPVGRRGFLKGATLGTAALAARPQLGKAQTFGDAFEIDEDECLVEIVLQDPPVAILRPSVS